MISPRPLRRARRGRSRVPRSTGRRRPRPASELRAHSQGRTCRARRRQMSRLRSPRLRQRHSMLLMRRGSRRSRSRLSRPSRPGPHLRWRSAWRPARRLQPPRTSSPVRPVPLRRRLRARWLRVRARSRRLWRARRPARSSPASSRPRRSRQLRSPPLPASLLRCRRDLSLPVTFRRAQVRPSPYPGRWLYRGRRTSAVRARGRDPTGTLRSSAVRSRASGPSPQTSQLPRRRLRRRPNSSRRSS